MQILDLQSDSLPRNAKPGFQVALIYEDAEAGTQARRFYEKLERHFEHEFAFSQHMWNFAVLGLEEVREEAAGLAAKADLVVLSLCGDAELPEEIKAWIEGWLERASHKPALVALSEDPKHPVANRVQDFLHDAAAHRRVPFFPHRPQAFIQRYHE